MVFSMIHICMTMPQCSESQVATKQTMFEHKKWRFHVATSINNTLNVFFRFSIVMSVKTLNSFFLLLFSIIECVEHMTNKVSMFKLSLVIKVDGITMTDTLCVLCWAVHWKVHKLQIAVENFCELIKYSILPKKKLYYYQCAQSKETISLGFVSSSLTFWFF